MSDPFFFLRGREYDEIVHSLSPSDPPKQQASRTVMFVLGVFDRLLEQHKPGWTIDYSVIEFSADNGWNSAVILVCDGRDTLEIPIYAVGKLARIRDVPVGCGKGMHAMTNVARVIADEMTRWHDAANEGVGA